MPIIEPKFKLHNDSPNLISQHFSDVENNIIWIIVFSHTSNCPGITTKIMNKSKLNLHHMPP